ncbi:kinase-like domain-containing protein [Cladochytrium replicatum]|nr:kinase-like domain-containing protein [Cladochytrium replicatum]
MDQSTLSSTQDHQTLRNLKRSIFLERKSESRSQHKLHILNLIDKNFRGAFGVVRVVQERATKMVYACKAVAKKKDSPYMYNQMLGEINIMKQVRHPHIIRMNEVYETPKKVYIIMEYCRGGELAQKVRARRTWSEEEARIIMARLVNAVAYLHDNGIVHRDIKAENVLLSTDIPNDPFNIKVSDFGLATSTDACTMMESVVGTPLYMAPEIIQNLPYSAQCDVWSIGIMMYLLICGYRYDAELAVKRMICDGKITYPEKYWANVHPAARSLSEAMLKFDPAKRISAKEVLRHPWITVTEMFIAVAFGDSWFLCNQGECTDPNKSNTSLFTKTVLDLMRSYNNEKRLRRAFLVAQAAVRLWRGRDCLRRWS